jgi:hypothetical protein
VSTVPKLKTYQVGQWAIISSAVQEALGLPVHRSQGRIFITAATKAAGAQLTEQTPGIYAERASALRLPMGNAFDAMAAAGLFNEPGIVVTTTTSCNGDTAVRVATDGTITLLGRLRSIKGSYRYVFDLAGE